MKKCKTNLSKKEITEKKRTAKKRKNRRLSDGEHHRVMAQVDKKIAPLPLVEVPSVLIRNNCTEKESKEIKCIREKLSKALQEVAQESRSTPEKWKNNRRLTNKQFKELMKKASIELGINDKKGLPILDVWSYKPVPIRTQFERILVALSNSQSFVYDQYMELVKGRRFKLKDKLAIFGWLMYPHMVNKPFCLIPKKERCNDVRKIGLKKWGDVKIRPVRVMLDEEYLREVAGKKRKKKDVFDRMHVDKKIEWARHAKTVIGDDIVAENVQNLFYTEEMNIMIVAMKYACKMTGISYFRSVYAEPYWIVYRINKYHNQITNKEYDVFLKIAQDHLGTGDKKTEPIMSDGELHDKLGEILKSFGLTKSYNKWCVRRQTVKTKDGRSDLKALGRNMSVGRIDEFLKEHYQTN